MGHGFPDQGSAVLLGLVDEDFHIHSADGAAAGGQHRAADGEFQVALYLHRPLVNLNDRLDGLRRRWWLCLFLFLLLLLLVHPHQAQVHLLQGAGWRPARRRRLKTDPAQAFKGHLGPLVGLVKLHHLFAGRGGNGPARHHPGGNAYGAGHHDKGGTEYAAGALLVLEQEPVHWVVARRRAPLTRSVGETVGVVGRQVPLQRPGLAISGTLSGRHLLGQGANACGQVGGKLGIGGVVNRTCCRQLGRRKLRDLRHPGVAGGSPVQDEGAAEGPEATVRSHRVQELGSGHDAGRNAAQPGRGTQLDCVCVGNGRVDVVPGHQRQVYPLAGQGGKRSRRPA